MFSGIIEGKAVVSECQVTPRGATLLIHSEKLDKETKVGDSIAVNGVCLTVTSLPKPGHVSFDVVKETLRRSTLGMVKKGNEVNIEHSLRVGERIHGHIVSGHVDEVVRVTGILHDGDSIRITFDLPKNLRRFLVEKGSVAINGVSLTVGEVSKSSFSVYIVPHTASVTTFGVIDMGSEVNIEVDMLARYVTGALASGK